MHLAGIAVAHAAGMGEVTGRRLVERAAYLLRPDAPLKPVPDAQVLVLLNHPDTKR
jgi:hypothetical protein